MASRRFSICWPDTQPLQVVVAASAEVLYCFRHARIDLPVLVLPAGEVSHLDPGGEAYLAFLQLDFVVLALLVLAYSPVVGRDL